MVESLPQPEVVRCYFDDDFGPRVAVMCLRWPAEALGSSERVWELPEGVRLMGQAPERFGVSIQRQGADDYAVRLLWDRAYIQWPTLNREQLLTSSLTRLLDAMGTDLWYLLDQPIEAANAEPLRAA